MKILKMSLFLWFLLFNTQAKLIEHRETTSFKEILKKANDVIAEQGLKQDEILFVFDIDNTTMAMTQDLGSDQWYSWQEKVISTDPKQSMAVASDISGLLDIQTKLFILFPMRPTEPDLAQTIKGFQSKGKTLLLTSRGYSNRNATERELEKNDLHFHKLNSLLKGSRGFAGKYYPYELDKLESYGLESSDAALVKNSPARLSSYVDGLFMTAGQHKGVMLKTLLHKLGAKPKVIFFTDDHKKHTDGMGKAFETRDEKVYTFHYNGELEKVKAFNQGDKGHVFLQWLMIDGAIDSVLQ